MKKGLYLLPYTMIGFLALTSAKAQCPKPCIKVHLYMHGGYSIYATVDRPCAGSADTAPLEMGQTHDFCIEKNSNIKIMASTGLGTQKNIFEKNIETDYDIDCGGLMGSTYKCDSAPMPM